MVTCRDIRCLPQTRECSNPSPPVAIDARPLRPSARMDWNGSGNSHYDFCVSSISLLDTILDFSPSWGHVGLGLFWARNAPSWSPGPDLLFFLPRTYITIFWTAIQTQSLAKAQGCTFYRTYTSSNMHFTLQYAIHHPIILLAFGRGGRPSAMDQDIGAGIVISSRHRSHHKWQGDLTLGRPRAKKNGGCGQTPFYYTLPQPQKGKLQHLEQCKRGFNV